MLGINQIEASLLQIAKIAHRIPYPFYSKSQSRFAVPPTAFFYKASQVLLFCLKSKSDLYLKIRSINGNYLSVIFEKRSRLLLSLVLLVLSPFSYAALSAKTANTVQGRAPLFVISGPNAIDFADFKYFGVRYKQIDYYVPSQLGAALDADGYHLTVTTPADLIDLFNTTGATSPLTLALGTPNSAEIIDEDGDGIHLVPLAELTTGSVTIYR